MSLRFDGSPDGLVFFFLPSGIEPWAKQNLQGENRGLLKIGGREQREEERRGEGKRQKHANLEEREKERPKVWSTMGGVHLILDGGLQEGGPRVISALAQANGLAPERKFNAVTSL